MKLTAKQKKVFDCIYNCPNSPGKYAMLNAIRCLDKAWKLKKIDPNISVFLLITAEEEAATALIQALKRHHYLNSDKLNHKKHYIKTSIYIFFGEIYNHLKTLGKMAKIYPRIEDIDHNPCTSIAFEFKYKNKPFYAQSPVPFDFGVTIINNLTNEKINMLEFIKPKLEVSSMKKNIHERTENRNRLLYASSNKIYKTDYNSAIRYYEIQKKRMIQYILLFLAIDPYSKIQPFFQELLNLYIDVFGIN